MSELKTFEEFPPILAKRKSTGSVRERTLLEFISVYAHCKGDVVGAYKPRFSFLPKKWKDYSFFESAYLTVSSTEDQRNKIDRLGGDPSSATTYDQAEKLIVSLKKELPPTPSVR